MGQRTGDGACVSSTRESLRIILVWSRPPSPIPSRYALLSSWFSSPSHGSQLSIAISLLPIQPENQTHERQTKAADRVAPPVPLRAAGHCTRVSRRGTHYTHCPEPDHHCASRHLLPFSPSSPHPLPSPDISHDKHDCHPSIAVLPLLDSIKESAVIESCRIFFPSRLQHLCFSIRPLDLATLRILLLNLILRLNQIRDRDLLLPYRHCRSHHRAFMNPSNPNAYLTQVTYRPSFEPFTTDRESALGSWALGCVM